MAEKNYPVEVFHPIFLTPSRRADAAFVWYRPARDAWSACKTAHVGTTRPTQRSKWLRRCVFSDLCRNSDVNLPPAGGFGVRVLPASAVLISNGDACAFLATQEKPKTQPASHAAKKEFSIIRSAQHMKPRISAPQIP